MKLLQLEDKYKSLDKSLRREVERRSCPLGRYLYDLIIHNEVKHAVEIGTFKGRTTLYMAAACDENHGRVMTININQGELNIAQRLAREIGLSNIDFVCGDSLKELPQIANRMPYQFAFIDGLHSYHYSKTEFDILSKCIDRTRSIIILDDVAAEHADSKGDGGVPRTAKEVNAIISEYNNSKFGYVTYGSFNMRSIV